MSNGIQRNGSSSPNKADESLLPPKVTSNHSYIEQSETRVYKRRWYILIMYCINGIMQNAMWNTFGPIETTARAVYKWDGWVIDLIAAWGSVTFCITMLPFAWVVDVKGLRVGVLLSAGFALVGSVLRFIPTGSTTSSTVLIHCGQIIIGLAGGIAAAPLLSSTWFPPSQRTTATAISSVASYVGTSLSFLVGPTFVDDVKDSNAVKVGDNYRLNETEEEKYQKQINSLLYTQSGLQAVFFFFVFVYYPSKPPSPPSHSAATVRVDFKDGARRLITNFNFLLLATIYGATTGVYGGWCAVLYQNLSGYGIDVNEHFAEWLGFVAVMSGAVSGVSFSAFADRFTGHLKFLLIVFMAFSLFAILLIYYVFTRVIGFNKGLVYVLFSLSGFFLNGTIPLFYELGVELTYPVAEGITSGSVMFFNNFLQSIFLVVPLGHLGTKWMLWATIGTCAASTLLLVFVKETYNRSSVDKRAKIENDFSSSSLNM